MSQQPAHMLLGNLEVKAPVFSDNVIEQPFPVDNVNNAAAGATLPESLRGHQRKAGSREDTEFLKARHEQSASGQGNSLQRQELPAVTSSMLSSVQPTGELSTGRQGSEVAAQHLAGEHAVRSGIGASPLKPTYGDVPKRGLSGVGSKESSAFERFNTESPYRNPGPGQSPMHHQLPQGRLGRKLGQPSPSLDRERRMSGGATFTPGTPGRARSDRGAALPKFGDWDATNPASGEGFTAIFDKARVEKKLSGAVSVIPAESPLRMKTEGDDIHMHPSGAHESSFLSWLYCCSRPSPKQ